MLYFRHYIHPFNCILLFFSIHPWLHWYLPAPTDMSFCSLDYIWSFNTNLNTSTHESTDESGSPWTKREIGKMRQNEGVASYQPKIQISSSSVENAAWERRISTAVMNSVDQWMSVVLSTIAIRKSIISIMRNTWKRTVSLYCFIVWFLSLSQGDTWFLWTFSICFQITGKPFKMYLWQDSPKNIPNP